MAECKFFGEVKEVVMVNLITRGILRLISQDMLM